MYGRSAVVFKHVYLQFTHLTNNEENYLCDKVMVVDDDNKVFTLELNI